MIPFFQKIVDVLNELRIPYMLSGSVAMSMYIVPRLTQDFDFVVYMHQPQILNFIKKFEDGFYYNEEAIKEAIKYNSMFNIVDNETLFKADFILMKEDDYGIEAFNRRQETNYYDRNFFIITEEDLIISKLKWIQDSQSVQQKADIANLMKVETLDWQYITKWIKRLKLETFNLMS